MRRFSFIFTLSLFFFVSCSFVTESKMAALSILLPSNNRSRSAQSSDVDSYSISIEPHAFDRIDVNANSVGNTIDFYDIGAGTYTVTINAYSDSGELLFSGSESAAIKENTTTVLSIVLFPVKSETEATVVYYSDDVTKTLPASDVFTDNSPYLNGTLTLQGDITLSVSLPVSSDLTIDLNGHTVFWEQSEKPLFALTDASALVIKNGTITSSLLTKHTAPLVEQRGQIFALQNVTISNVLCVPASDSIDVASVLYIQSGTSYMDSVEISHCVVQGSSEGISGTVYIDGTDAVSALYAKTTIIKNCYAYTSSGIAVRGQNAKLSFIGGSIKMEQSPRDDLAKGETAALWVSDTSSAVFVSSATLYANSDSYPKTIEIVNGGDLNLSDGFLFEFFDFDENSVIHYPSYIFARNLGVTQSTTRIGYGTDFTQNSEHTAVSLGKESYLYVNGNTRIYGAILFVEENAHIQQTGILDFEENAVLNIKFADDIIDSYRNSNLLIGLFYKPSDVQSQNFDISKYNLLNDDYEWGNRSFVDGAGTYFSVYFPKKD